MHVELTPTARGYDIEARVRTTAQTGVEMEALTAVAVAALTIYDMVKAVDKGMVIGDIRLMYKTGGKSGTYRRPDNASKRNAACASCSRCVVIGVFSPSRRGRCRGRSSSSCAASFLQHTFLDAWDGDDAAPALARGRRRVRRGDRSRSAFRR